MNTSIQSAPADSATRSPQDRSREGSPLLGGLGMFVLLLGPFLANLDFFITNVALPTIDRDLQASAAALELIVAGYGTAYAVLLVVGGRLGDAFGRRNVFAWGLAGFTLTSLLAGIAPTTDTLIFARVVQGASAAMITPQVLATFQATLTGEARGRAISLYAAAGGLSAVAGQLVGGLLLSLNVAGTEWRGIFLVNVPVGILALLLLRRVVPETRSPSPASVDIAGTALLGVALVALLIPLTEGPALGWPWWIWACLALVPLVLTALVIVERRGERSGRTPLLPPSLLALPSIRRGLPVAALFFMGFGAFVFVFALTVQNGLHVSALRSGLLITPTTVAYVSASLLVPRLLARYGRTVLTIGMTLQAIGLGALLIAATANWPDVSLLASSPGLILAGIGQALGVGAIFRLVLSDVPSHLAGIGSGILITVQQAALALGVASLGTLFTSMSDQRFISAVGVAIGVQIAITIVIGLVSLTLPRPSS